ncbi:MAG: 50S ribosomal protein L18 [Chlamydiales bacterium]|nr:50S ribosomal protein L18 [Chlamydiales bacterium]MCH9619785.1 50S ribosomal protein L18 [Chlamydiales bacterium]MCH9623391.1 50S ribosomal protein L18 [Chlamydiales bacterium]
MKNDFVKRNTLRKKRAVRVRKKLKGLKPRLVVMRSNRHIHIQLVDDQLEKTVASVSTLSKEFKEGGKNKTSAKKLGEKIGELALKKKVKEVVFDRGCQMYHGILAAVADGAREAGLKF